MYMQIYILKTYSIDMGMQKESTAGKCSEDMQHGNTACACSMYMLQGHAAWRISRVLLVYAALTCTLEMARTCRMDKQHGHVHVRTRIDGHHYFKK
jgi:hypothetical protein